MTTMVVSMAIMLLVSSLIEHYAVSEAKAVDESLARIRIYWAMMGQWNYVASRSISGVVNNTPNTENYRGYFGYFRVAYNNATPDDQDYCKFSATTDCSRASNPGNAPALLPILKTELASDATQKYNCDTILAKGTDYGRLWYYPSTVSDQASAVYCFLITDEFFKPSHASDMALGLYLRGVGTVPVLGSLQTRILPLYVESHLTSATAAKIDSLYRPVVAPPP